jgi:hypothetical protein
MRVSYPGADCGAKLVCKCLDLLLQFSSYGKTGLAATVD